MSQRQSTLIALLVAVTFFMENLDATVIATALPDMANTQTQRTLVYHC